MTIEIRTSQSGIFLPVKAQPGSKRNAIVGEYAGRLKIAVTVVAEKGKANVAIIKLLAKELGLSKSQIRIVSGETSAHKTLEITDVSASDLQTQIEELIKD